MFVKALLLDIDFYNINMNLKSTEWLITCSILSIFLSKSKNQHICFHGNYGINIGLRFFQLLILKRILISCIVYVKCIPVEVEI